MRTERRLDAIDAFLRLRVGLLDAVVGVGLAFGLGRVRLLAQRLDVRLLLGFVLGEALLEAFRRRRAAAAAALERFYPVRELGVAPLQRGDLGRRVRAPGLEATQPRVVVRRRVVAPRRRPRPGAARFDFPGQEQGDGGKHRGYQYAAREFLRAASLWSLRAGERGARGGRHGGFWSARGPFRPPGFLLRSYLCHKNEEKPGLAALLHACAPAADYCSINSEDSLSGYLVRVQVLCPSP